MMKQKEDDKTVDMFEVLEKYAPKSSKASKYRFYIETTGGETIEWRGLSLTVAKSMYNYTDKSQPLHVKRCGWEEIS